MRDVYVCAILLGAAWYAWGGVVDQDLLLGRVAVSDLVPANARSCIKCGVHIRPLIVLPCTKPRPVTSELVSINYLPDNGDIGLAAFELLNFSISQNVPYQGVRIALGIMYYLKGNAIVWKQQRQVDLSMLLYLFERRAIASVHDLEQCVHDCPERWAFSYINNLH